MKKPSLHGDDAGLRVILGEAKDFHFILCRVLNS